ncbi:hypothetical protein LPC08_16095 [Roseomonas sp. OT10]|uniref:hypothetical protein n=1 Tax=Roseomonas cutis TaxID=2897332 RepID=UPI001E38911F|nr:hypothetical protein [Roseomonas sp. OT10]UFN47529.1 hypothetical protein LPC08_16095 [Roseomonas sp. OT10]
MAAASAALLAAALLLAMAGPARSQPAEPAAAAAAPSTGGGYTQRNVPAEATAEDAVKAREQAYASAQRIAYERMASELGLPTGLSASQIDRLVSSIVVEQERASRTGFTGRVTVNFNPGRVASLGGRAPSGGGSGGGPTDGGGATAPAAAPVPRGPASFWVEAAAGYRSLPEWLQLHRRLLGSPQVASVDVRALAVDRARIRIGLRAPADAMAPELAAAGLTMQLAPDGSWRLGLAGGA